MKRTSIRFLILAFVLLFVNVKPWQSVDAASSYNAKNGDPCSINMRLAVPINLIAGGQLITGKAGKYTYICHLSLVTAAAQNIALVEGTGAVCATNTAGMAGGATAATGWNLGANQALVMGDGGWQINSTATAADNVCLLLSGIAQTSGVIQYVQQ